MSLPLNFEERRILGTLVEKAYTTPEQCPLTLNSLVSGCNQKSCRDPVTYFDEEKVLRCLDKLREKGLAVLVRTVGSRVDRWRQQLADVWELSPPETAVVVELLLRGAQTDGELRQRASRMVKIESLDVLRELLRSLQTRNPPLVGRASPPGKRRGAKYDHLLYPEDEKPAIFEEDADLEPAALPVVTGPIVTGPDVPSAPSLSDLHAEIRALRETVSELTERVAELETRPESAR